MEKVMNNIIYEKILNSIKSLKKIENEIWTYNIIIERIIAVTGGNIINFGEKIGFNSLIFASSLLLYQNSPNAFLDISLYNFFLLISPKHLGNFGQ